MFMVFIWVFFFFFLNACQLGNSSGGCCRMKQDAPEPLWRGGGTGGTVGNAVDGFPLPRAEQPELGPQ